MNMAVREGDPGEKYKRKNSIGFDVDFFATPLGLVRVLETVSYYLKICFCVKNIFWNINDVFGAMHP